MIMFKAWFIVNLYVLYLLQHTFGENADDFDASTLKFAIIVSWKKVTLIANKNFLI